MQKMFLKGALVGALSSLLVTAATVAVAANGGNFILGASNSATNVTGLSGTSGNGMLNVVNNATSAGQPTVKGVSKTPAQAGVLGEGTNGPGVIGRGNPAVQGVSGNGIGVVGTHSNTTGAAAGVQGKTSAPDGVGGFFQNATAGPGTAGKAVIALGRAAAGADINIGGDGFAGAIEAAGPNGVEGNSTTAGGFGVSGDAPAVGVRGNATAAGGTGGSFTAGTNGNGVNSFASGTGTGVLALGGNVGLEASGTVNGVHTNVTAAGAVGVSSTTGSSANDAVQGNTSGGISDAIQGTATGGGAFAVFGIATGGGIAGVFSTSNSTGISVGSGSGRSVSAGNNSATNPTVVASNSAAGGTGGNFTGDIGVNVENNDSFGIGLLASLSGDTNGDGTANNDGNQAINAFTDDTNSPNTIQADNGGVPSDALTAEAIEAFGFVDINGSARVTGNLDVVGSCCTVADNPLDPAGSYLRHGTVASPEMKNIYDGVVTTDGSGRATVELPDYFGAYNRDFRYQLTVVGVFAQAIVSQEIPAGGNAFEIRTDKPGVKVSWQVTGVRDDAYAKAHPIHVVERKTGKAAGEYLHPELFGQPGATPLGVDGRPTPAPATSAAAAQAEADLQALIARKRAQALKEAEQVEAPRPRRAPTQGK